MSAVARHVLTAFMVVGFLGAVALPLKNLVMESPVPKAKGVYTVPAICGTLVSLVAGVFRLSCLPTSWTVDERGINFVGPFGRRSLEWGDIRRVMPGSAGYSFHGPGLASILLRWDSIPGERRGAVRAEIEAILREHFDIPSRPHTSIARLLAWMFMSLAIIFGPCLAYWSFWLRLLKNSPRTILEWDWVNRLFAWNPGVAVVILWVVFYGLGLAYSAFATVFVVRKAIRVTQILPKRPQVE